MYPGDWRVRQDGFVMARRCTSSKDKFYLDCQVMEPVSHTGRTIQLPVSKPKLTKKQIEQGLEETYQWSVRGLLDMVFQEPQTLEDIGLSMTTVETVNQTILNLWCGVPTTAAMAAVVPTEQSGGSAEPPRLS
eukprot:955097-Rhodomonas_salina.1